MVIDDTFAEAFGMTAARVIITAFDQELASEAAAQAAGHASSVIGCNCEAGIESLLEPELTPDGRPGVSLLFFGFSRDKLEKAIVARIGQNVLTCPTTACYNGLPVGAGKMRVGGQLRYFGDGFQMSKKFDERRFWRIPVMDGEFVCEDEFGTMKGIGGGNLLICGADAVTALAAARAARDAIAALPDVIMPFPSGIVRSGSKVGARYPQLPASTNDRWCPSLTSQTETDLQPEDRCVYEIVIDGLTEAAVAGAMTAGIMAVSAVPGVTRISAGNYGGRLGPHHFHLHRLSGVSVPAGEHSPLARQK
ncbi:MAG: formylmethanofuran--tetrahydromethanopterin N-formyltransferase [Planctomycetaceae bacterium]|nr:formylmethanofuran--tetrahydromethanopterin N-formyltransferase [Planctomycetaceae bacterium]